MTKNIFKSWTIWFGILQVLLGGVGMFSGNLGQTEAFTLITTGLGTIGLRIKTSQPVI